MKEIIYIVGAIVIVLALLSFVSLHRTAPQPRKNSMITDNLPLRPISAETSGPDALEGSYVDWAAILAGAVFALAISFLLVGFTARR